MLIADVEQKAFSDLSFEIFPVIHLREGKTVNFTDKEPDDSAIFPDLQPLETVRFWVDEGAQWVHIVDLDAMFRDESRINWQLIKQICQLPVKVQLAGGHFDKDDIAKAFDIGVTRVLLDSLQPDVNLLASTAITTYGPESLGVVFTTRAVGRVGAIGQSSDWPTDWAAAGGEEVVTRALQLHHLGITTGVHVTIDEDGSMSGCDVRITQELASLSGMNFLVGGEIYDMDDVVNCFNRKGVTGVLIGRALNNGTINLDRALRITHSKIVFETGLPAWKNEQASVRARLRYNLSQSYLINHLPYLALTVLDAGGGNGQDALCLAAEGHQVHLVDQSTAMLADFEERSQYHPAAGGVTTHNADLRKIPDIFEEEQFDVVLCHNVLQYVDDWESVLESAIRPLKRGGVFSLLTRNRLALPYQIDYENVGLEELKQITESFVGNSLAFESKVNLYTPSILQTWLLRNQFETVHQYGILCLHQYTSLLNNAENELLVSKLMTVEQQLGALTPHRDVAYYVQLIATKY